MSEDWCANKQPQAIDSTVKTDQPRITHFKLERPEREREVLKVQTAIRRLFPEETSGDEADSTFRLVAGARGRFPLTLPRLDP